MSELTEKQKRFLDFIQQFRDEHGYSPSVREIGKGLGLSSTASVKNMLDRLEEKNLIQRGGNTARSTTLPGESTSSQGVPVIGRIRAGMPVEAEEHVEAYVPVREFLKKATDGFFLIVEGDSMRDAGILEGDLAFIRPSKTIMNGQIGAFRINGEVTLKTFRRKDGVVHLEPSNPDYPVIVVTEHDEFEVIGRYVMLMRLVEGGYDLGFA